MASELLKTFEKIENGRTSIINKLKQKGLPVDEKASLTSLAIYLDMFENPDYKIDKTDHILKTGYKNSDEDPDHWIQPSDWPNTEDILRQYDDYVYNNVVYVPQCLLLIGNEYEDINLVISSSYLTSLGITDKFIAFQNSSINNGINLYLVTSDGASYILNRTDQYVNHIWDNSKNLNNKYRYLIVYAPTSTTGFTYVFPNYMLFNKSDVQQIVVCTVGPLTNSSQYLINTSYPTGTSPIVPECIENIRFIDPFTERALLLASKKSVLKLGYISISTSASLIVKCVDEHTEESKNLVGYNISVGGVHSLIIYNKNLIPEAGIDNSYGALGNTFLLKVPFLAYNALSYTTSTTYYGRTVKYIELTHPELQQPLLTIDCLPYLASEDLYYYLQDTISQERSFRASCLHRSVLTLPNIKIASDINYVGADSAIIDIVNLPDCESYGLDSYWLRHRYLYLPNVSELTGIRTISEYALYAYLPKIKNLAINTFYNHKTNQTDSYQNHILVLDVSSLESMDIKSLSACIHLKEILFPEEIDFDVYLQCQPVLTGSCIKRIVSSLKDLTKEGLEQRTLVLNQKALTHLNQSLINEIISKGWDLQIKNWL